MTERRSSAPSATSPYTDDDFDKKTGKLKRLREVPLGKYPAAIAKELQSYNPDDFNAPPAPAAPPMAMPKKMSMAAKPVQSAKLSIEDPPEFRDPDHYIALVSYVENRHPDEDKILDHYARQQQARKEGKYEPTEDPPVDLRTIVPTLCVKVTRTFTREEAEANNGAKVREYAERLHKATDYTVLTLECGKAQPLPVSDLVRGIYKDKALQQQMDAFYRRREQSTTDILTRVQADAAELKNIK